MEDLKLKKERAYGYAVYLLSLKLRTEGEIREKMRLKKYSSQIVDYVVEQLLGNRYLDDQRYAEVYLENLKKYKNFGFYGIKKKLMEKRLPQEMIEQVLTDGLSTDEEVKIAKRFLAKEKSKTPYQTAEGGRDGARLAGKLKSRGFRVDVISKLLFLFYCFLLPVS